MMFGFGSDRRDLGTGRLAQLDFRADSSVRYVWLVIR
jgi:hypothetical protein